MWPFWGFGVYTLHVGKGLMCHINWPFFHVRYIICTDHKKAAETRSFRHENVSWIEWNEFNLALSDFESEKCPKINWMICFSFKTYDFLKYLSSQWVIKMKIQEPFNICDFVNTKMTSLGTKPKFYDNNSNILDALNGMNSLTISSRLFRSLVTCCGNGPIGISYPAKLRCQCI